MKPKVLIVGHLPTAAAGGITSLLLAILQSEITRKYELFTFDIARPPKSNVMNNSGYQALLNAGLKRAFVGIIVTLWHMVTFPFAVIWYRPAIIHIHTSAFLVFWETAYYVLVARVLRIPCSLQFHYSFRSFYETSHSWLRRAMLCVVRWPTVFVVICKEDMQFIKKQAGDPVRCVYLANFIDISGFHREVSLAREKSGKGAGVVALFMGGNESVRKGLFDLLQAIQKTSLPQSTLRFLLVAVPLEEVHSQLGDEVLSCCDIRSWVSGDSKIDAFAQADMFVLPSYGEGMPIGILEAMASSIPIIATRVGGIPDLITENREGYLIDPGDVEGLVKAIDRLASDSKTRKEMGKAGLAKARITFDVSVGIQQLQNLYDELANPVRLLRANGKSL